MTLPAAIVAHMTQTCVLRRAGARAAVGGKQTIATDGTTIRCRYARHEKARRGPDGEVRVSSAQVWLDAVYDISVGDEITLPDGTKPAIMAVDRYADPGMEHEKVWFV